MGQVVKFRPRQREQRRPFQLEALNWISLISLTVGAACILCGLVMLGEPLAYIGGGVALIFFGAFVAERFNDQFKLWRKKTGIRGWHE